MEEEQQVKRRESSLEVLRRLQAQNARSIPEIYKKPPVILRVEDIIDRDRVERFNPSKTKIVSTGKQSEAVMISNEIKDIEKQLKSGKSYFDSYYDLRKKEDKLVHIYETCENKDVFSEDITKRVKEIKKRLTKI